MISNIGKIFSKGGLIKNWSLLTIASIVQTVLGFLCTVRLARILDAAEFGKYTLVLTVVGMLQIVSVLSIRNVAIREISRRRLAMVPIAKHSAQLMLLSTFLCSLFLVGYLLFESDLQGSAVFISAVILLVSNSVWTYAETLAFALQEMHISSALNMIGSIVWLLIVFLTPAEYLTLQFALAGFAVVQMIRGSVYIYLEVQKRYFVSDEGIERSETVITMKELLRQSLPILGSAALAIPVMQLPLIFLARFSGMTEVGYYGVGNKLTQPIALISSTLFHAIYPRISGSFTNDPLAFRKQSESFFFVLTASSFLFALTFGTFSREIILTLFGPNYEGVIAPFSAQVWMVSIWVLNNYFGSLLMASNNERSLFVVSIFNSLLIGAASYFGAYDGAFGLAIYSLVSCIASFIGFRWYLNRAIPGLLGDGSVVRSMFLLAAAGAATVAISLVDLIGRILFFAAAIVTAYVMNRGSLPSSVGEFRAILRGV